MDKDYLVLKRASTSRASGEWSDDDYDVLADGDVVGRIFKVHAAPVGTPWMWTLAFGHSFNVTGAVEREASRPIPREPPVTTATWLRRSMAGALR